MNFFIYRNTTVEPFFSNIVAQYSGYADISSIPTNVDCFIWFYLLPVKSDPKLLSIEIGSFYSSLNLILKKIPSTKIFYIFTLVPLYTNLVETGDYSLQKSIDEFNHKLIDLSKSYKNTKIIDFKSFLSTYSLSQLIDWKYYYISKTLLNPKFAGDFRNWFNYQTIAIQMKRKKCLVLDLDNTLWGGVVGEDGINGIKIGGDYPGNAFEDFQKSILELNKSGIILTICSKNNETDILELWEKNPNIIVKKEHLAGYRINWKNKAENIKELIAELNIGLDSVVLIDDNPAERELVKQFLPEVETPEFPLHPYLLPVFIRDITEKYFRIYQLTDEDRLKTLQYNSNALRDQYKAGFSDFTDYLTSLEMVMELQEANELTVARIAQLTQKTNQFNLTTKRYSENEILVLMRQGYAIYTIRVKDKFGDHGITGLIICKIDQNAKSAEIDSFLLSCRILGKGIEETFAHAIFNKLKMKGIKIINATYLPTNKNQQVKDFYNKLGFVSTSDQFMNENRSNYKIELSGTNFEIKPYYKINEIANERKD